MSKTLSASTLSAARREIQHWLQRGGCDDHPDTLLEHCMQRPKAWLHAHPEHVLAESERTTLEDSLSAVLAGHPFTQLRGHCEFYSLEFRINEAVLAPRPETELLVDCALSLPLEQAQVLDLGCGSGNIACTLQTHRPDWEITASDCSPPALAVAKDNAERLNCTTIRFMESDWFMHIPQCAAFDLIISNPPYIAIDDPQLEPRVARFEPDLALYAEHDGLAALYHIIERAPAYLKANGQLLLEHGHRQRQAVCEQLLAHGYVIEQQITDYAGLERAVLARKA